MCVCVCVDPQKNKSNHGDGVGKEKLIDTLILVRGWTASGLRTEPNMPSFGLDEDLTNVGSSCCLQLLLEARLSRLP